MIPSPERWPTKDKEAPSTHGVRQVPLGLNFQPNFQKVGDGGLTGPQLLEGDYWGRRDNFWRWGGGGAIFT